ncbi:unnamed protein product [Merluccius merluccius]
MGPITGPASAFSSRVLTKRRPDLVDGALGPSPWQHVFLDRDSAGQLLRSRRANSHLLEELRPGNLERECYEEACSKEEAKEIFQSHEKTMEFWHRYTSLNPCETNRCLNGGICKVDGGHFLCLCPPQFQGAYCQTAVLECRYRNGGCLQYCTDQIQDGTPGVQCGCAAGYQLDPDGQHCSKTVPFPCGMKRNQPYYYSRSLNPERPITSSDIITETNVTTETNIPMATSVTMETNITTETNVSKETNITQETNVTRETEGTTDVLESEQDGTYWDEEEQAGGRSSVDPRIIGGLLERQGASPWQVLVHRKDGYGFCGGTLVSDRWVVSAAHCFELKPDHVTVGDYDKKRMDPGEQVIKVEKLFLHPHFHSHTFDSDLALIYLAQQVVLGPIALPVCLPTPELASYLHEEGNSGTVTGWGAMQYLRHSSRFLRRVVLPLVTHEDCMSSTEHLITDNMFCAGYLEASMDACSGDSGGPFVVTYRDTAFLLGVVSWGEQCAAKGKYGVYTRLGNFLSWIHDTMERHEEEQTQLRIQNQGLTTMNQV